MRIREFMINRYGPVNTGGRIELADFNLLFGRNEAGKSLTIDALVKMLLGKGLKGFD
ncbi:MAG: AAA family ATPase, partial [Candidatus Latescibacteria bacterium]|nr:AAA family ATPase [bacterium]MBD3425588.1 AAA family ATPase [Candidatus Latescibacterota bacterium]